MATVDYYVSLSGNDTTGLNWTDAKTTIQGAIDLITDIVTDDITIHVEGDTASPIEYTGDVTIKGIKILGEDAGVVLQPGSASTTTWDDSNYEGADKSPFISAAGSGTWNIKTDTRPVVIKGNVELFDSGPIEFCGFKFDGDTSFSYLKAEHKSSFKAVYCHLYGKTASAMISGMSFCHIENSYFEENRNAIMVVGKSFLTLEGDNYIENAWEFGIYALIDSYVQISPWEEDPLEHFTTEIKTTGGRDKYAAVKAAEKSFIKIWNGWEDYDIEIGAMKIVHELSQINPRYYCIALEKQSLLSGSEKIDFLMLNTKDEDVEIPDAHQIVADSSSQAF